MKFFRKNKGITLVALVATIVIMLILAGVTLNIALGENGLFNMAKLAGEKTKEAIKDEQRVIAIANAAMHEEKEWVYTTEDGERIPIPAGFAPTEIDGENSIKDGLVIIDSEGNEFVWIPCTSSEYKLAIYDASWSRSSSYDSGEWNDSQTAIGESSLKGLEDKKQELNLTDKGIGFYVARYEAGIPKEAPFYASKDGDLYKLGNVEGGKNNTDFIPVSKKGEPAWNCISQINAKTVSEKMYSRNATVNSYLIDSHAWNYICGKILNKEKDIINSTKWGNYYANTTTKYEELDVLYVVHLSYNSTVGDKYNKGLIPEGIAPRNEGNNFLELSTGASEDFKAYNIYDMAGNMWEITTELGTIDSSQDEQMVIRGYSFYDHEGIPSVTWIEPCTNTWVRGTHVGFRVVLYL